MKQLKALVTQDLANSVTLIWPLGDFYGHKVSYRYQRQDFSIKGKSDLDLFYPGVKSRWPSVGHFTRSGQSATFGLALALKNSLPEPNYRPLCKYTYFESKRVFEGLKWPVSPLSETAFLDASTAETDVTTYLENLTAKRLIVDTTTCAFNAPEIQTIVNWCETQLVELFLIKSHLKLDCLGAEYGLLGSILHLAPEISPEWEKFLLETLSYAGLLATQEQVYPFLWDKNFQKLSVERIQRIQSNTAYFQRELQKFLPGLKHPMRLQTFQHGLFFGLFYEGKADHLPEKFLKLALMHEVPAKYCDSFGFDFLSLTNVVSFYEATNESALRICSGDNTQKREDTMKLLKDYLAFFDQRT